MISGSIQNRSGLGAPYWRLWAASTVSGVGDGLFLVGFPLLAVSLTADPLLVAGAAAALRLPWLLVAIPAGALVDRLPAAKVVSFADGIRFLLVGVLGVLAASGRLTLPTIYAIAFCLGTLETLHAAASHAAIPQLAHRSSLERANGWLTSASDASTQLVGPALGGMLFAAAAMLPFVLDAATFAVAAALALTLVHHTPRAPRPAESDATSTLRAEMRAGVRVFRANPLLRSLTTLITGLAFSQALAYGVLVLFATQELGLSQGRFGLLLALGAVGNVAGAALTHRARRQVPPHVVLTSAALVSGGALALMALAPTLALVGALFVVEAVAVAMGNVVSAALRQTAVPVAYLGRVGNVVRTCIWGAIPIGTAAGGYLAGVAGLRAPFLVAGISQIAVGLATATSLRRYVGAPETGTRPATRVGAVSV